jgi:hypothetical protein
MDWKEAKFREFFHEYRIQDMMKRLDKAGVSPVVRATSIMALRRIFNEGEFNESNELTDLGKCFIKFNHHVKAIIEEMEVA